MGTPNMTITEPTQEELNAQIERENELNAADGVEGGDTESGIVAGADGEGEPRQQEPAPKPVQMSPQDQKRIDMANRFKRPGVEVPFDGDMTKAENLYGDVAAEALEPDPDAPEPGVSPQPRAEPQPAPRMITMKVRGKDVTLTEDEWLARAAKVEAADSYLEEGRSLLANAKQIRAERAGRDPQHPEGQRSTQDDGLDNDDQSAARTHAPDLKSVVEKIQFGDPEEAARELEDVINTVSDKRANEGHIARLVKNDLAKAQADLKAFVDANPELAKDEIAANVIENSVYKIYREEIMALGVDEAQIPKDPKSLADWHRLYRVHGHSVSKPADVLVKAKARLDEWRGTSSAPKPAAPRKDPARVVVNVDRTERRMAIPQQPSRAVAPRRDAAPVKQESSRKDAVAEMRRARGQPVV